MAVEYSVFRFDLTRARCRWCVVFLSAVPFVTPVHLDVVANANDASAGALIGDAQKQTVADDTANSQTVADGTAGDGKVTANSPIVAAGSDKQTNKKEMRNYYNYHDIKALRGYVIGAQVDVTDSRNGMSYGLGIGKDSVKLNWIFLGNTRCKSAHDGEAESVEGSSENAGGPSCVLLVAARTSRSFQEFEPVSVWELQELDDADAGSLLNVDDPNSLKRAKQLVDEQISGWKGTNLNAGARKRKSGNEQALDETFFLGEALFNDIKKLIGVAWVTKFQKGKHVYLYAPVGGYVQFGLRTSKSH